MGQFFHYSDKKHRIGAFPVLNEKGEVVGYRGYISRVNGIKGGLVEDITRKLRDLRFICFSTEEVCRLYSSNYMCCINSEDEINRGFLSTTQTIKLKELNQKEGIL